MTFDFQPKSAAYEVKSVEVDGQAIGQPSSYTFPQASASHALKVTFAKKKLEIKVTNLTPSGGRVKPGKSLILPYGASRIFTAKPKKGYLAVIRLDGQDVKLGRRNQPIRYKLGKITVAHSLDALFVTAYTPPSPTPLPSPKSYAEVSLNVDATDPNGWPLHYQWGVSEGTIDQVDHQTTTWRLPPGPGVHFANVLISNHHGGYTERRIAVISDAMGIVSPTAAPKDFDPPAQTTAAASHSDMNYLVAWAGTGRYVYLRNAALVGSNPAQTTEPSNWLGQLMISASVPKFGNAHLDFLDLLLDKANITYPPQLPDARTTPVYGMAGAQIDAWAGATAFYEYAQDADPPIHGVQGSFIVGSATLADGKTPCGIDKPFFDKYSSATATLLDNTGYPISLPVRVNAFGDYALLYDGRAASVKLECEESTPVITPVVLDSSGLGGVATQAVFADAASPVVKDDPPGMQAGFNGHATGLFLSPNLNDHSDQYPRGDLFLGYKGLDTQKSACEYYRAIGAVQGCDAKGHATGAITFDDWRSKVGLEPYGKPGTTEVKATYINRIDLNLTRKHHAVTYRDTQGPTVTQVNGGEPHSCAVYSDGQLFCWGEISGTPSGNNFAQIGRGHYFSCALKTDGRLVCWGDDSDHQVTDTPTGGDFVQLGVGGHHACAIRSDRSMVCWGNPNYYNDAGDPVPPAGNEFAQVSGGHDHICALKTDGSIGCWGDDSSVSSAPSDNQYVQISAGGHHNCAIRLDGSLTCWGDIAGTPAGNDFVQVAGGHHHSCALRTNGSLVCWGSTTGETPAGNDFSVVGAGWNHDCAAKADGSLVCWGNDSNGQVNDAPDIRRRTAAYVCNHLGPLTDAQADINTAIDNAINDRNEVACVAMDYGFDPHRKPYVRFLGFAPNGQLLQSINLDGREEKFVPATCTVCHGGDRIRGRFATDGSGSPDIGAHFLPYDSGNFHFSDKPGLTEADQQAAIKQLNQIVLTTNATHDEKNLIGGWYATGTDLLDKDYMPAEWKPTAAQAPYPSPFPYANPMVDPERLYKEVNARYCRTCHVAIVANRTQHTEGINTWFDGTGVIDDDIDAVVCGGHPGIHRNHTMPNSLVTFNLLWNDPAAKQLLDQLRGSTCQSQADPQLALPTATLPLQNGVASNSLNGTAGSQKLFSIKVPAGAILRVNLTPGAGAGGTPNLYVRAAPTPSAVANDCMSGGYAAAGIAASCELGPTTGDAYYILVESSADFSGWTLTATWELPQSLLNGIATGPLSGTQNSAKMFAITVAAGQALWVNLNPAPGASGNPTLYVRAASLPTTANNDCVSANSAGVAETCRIFPTPATTYYIVVTGTGNYSGWTLTAMGSTPTATALSNGVASSTLSATPLNLQFFSVNVPAGAALQLTLSSSAGATGTPNLYVRRAALPDLNDFDCVDTTGSAAVNCRFFPTLADTYYILVAASADFSGWSLIANWQVPTPTALSNGASTTLNSTLLNFQFFKATVPAGAALTVSLNPETGASGDPNLYVARNYLPGAASSDCGSANGPGATELCTLGLTNADTYYILVDSSAAFSGWSLKASWAAPTTLQNGVSANNLSGSTDLTRAYRVTVPAGQVLIANLTPATGTTGDPNLYIRKATLPSPGLPYDCGSANGAGAAETCALGPTTADTYYIVLTAAANYSGWSLKTSWAPPTALQNGNALANLSDTLGGAKYFSVTVPVGSILHMDLTPQSGAAGVPNLYVRRLEVPSAILADCSSVNGAGAAESCAVGPSATKDTYYILVSGATAYSSWSLKASWVIPTVLLSANNLSWALNSEQFFNVTVPAGGTLFISLTPVNGDADLFVRRGSQPTDTTYDCISNNGVNTPETCTFTPTAADTYYIRVFGFSAFSGGSLTATYQ